MKNIKYSIIVPTYNRAQVLARNLACISQLEAPVGAYEVIVIDNNSTDATSKVVDQWRDTINEFSCLLDPRPGLLYGRHAGARHARGEVLCYLDDDAFVTPAWLQSIEDVFADSGNVIATGPILPEYETPPPDWFVFFEKKCFLGKYNAACSLLDFEPETHDIPTIYVFGCNLIIRKEALFDCKGFNPDSVPKELQHFRGNGESGLALKLNAKGIAARYHTGIKVKHWVSSNKYTVDFFSQQGYKAGITDSFTQIRRESGLYTDTNFLWREDFREKRSRFLQNKPEPEVTSAAYEQYLEMQKAFADAYANGYDWHQQQVKKNPALKQYVLRADYLD